MKLRYVNPHNVKHLVPRWAVDPFVLAKTLDEHLGQYWSGKQPPPWDYNNAPRYWFEITPFGEGWGVRLAEPEDGQHPSPIESNAGQIVIETADWSISVPLNDVLKGAPNLEGTHSVYVHQFPDGDTTQYVGLTKQKWFVRLAQHEQRARAGSPYLFHRALRDRAGARITHRIFLTGMTYEEAMQVEEDLVEICGLYPRGLNMIPGGFAGLAYLSSLGVNAKSVHERDRLLEDLSAQNNLAGKPNPLCAARWASDQEYVNSVICGHSGRLSVDQVRNIRMLAASGKSRPKIADFIGDRVNRVADVLNGKTYARVA